MIGLVLWTALPALIHSQVQYRPQAGRVSSIAYDYSPLSSPLASIPSSNETVADLVAILEEEDISDTNSSVNANTNSSVPPSTTDYLAARSVPTPISPMQKVNRQRRLSAVYNSPDGKSGYNITIPGCLSADDIIGDIEVPNGTHIANATFANLMTSVQLPGDRLYNYTLTILNQTLNDANATLSKIVCDHPNPQGGGRELLWPSYLRPNWRDPGNSEGFMSAFVFGSLGVFGIGYGGTYLGIANQPPTQNITVGLEVGILAGTAMAEFMFVTMLFRLQSVERRWIGRAEAAVLNFFIWIGAQLIKLLNKISGSTCIPTGTARSGIQSVTTRMREQAVVIRTGIASIASTSSLTGLLPDGNPTSSGDNLPDLENPVQVGLQVANDAIQLQLTGNNRPGQTCG